MTYKHHTKLDLVEGGNIFKQGDHPTLKFIGYDSLGNEVDLTGKQIEGALFSRNKGIIYEAPASFIDGRFVFTIDELLDNGKFQLEFTVTDSADPNYRAKFPSDEYAAELTIKPSKDNMDFVGVSMTTVAQLKGELQGLQTEFAGQVLPRVDIVEDKQTQLEADYQSAAGALTEDSEVILARKGEPTLRAFNDKVVAQLADTGEQVGSNPMSFGAMGDGITDDTQAFINANVLSLSIRLPKGKTFRLDNFAPKEGTVIFAEGANIARHSQSYYADTSSSAAIVVANKNIVISGGKHIDLSPTKETFSGSILIESGSVLIKGALIENSWGGVFGHGSQSETKESDYVSIIDTEIRGCNHNTYLGDIKNFIFSRNHSHHSKGDGLRTYRNVRNIVITENHIYANGQGGTQSQDAIDLFVAGHKCIIANNHLYDNVVKGIDIKKDPSNVNETVLAEKFIITGNHIFNNALGIEFTSTAELGFIENVNITDNFVYDNTLQGIRSNFADAINYSRNQIFGNGEAGLRIDNTQKGGIVSENHFYNNGVTPTASPRAGAFITETAKNVDFIHNKLYPGGLNQQVGFSYSSNGICKDNSSKGHITDLTIGNDIAEGVIKAKDVSSSAVSELCFIAEKPMALSSIAFMTNAPGTFNIQISKRKLDGSYQSPLLYNGDVAVSAGYVKQNLNISALTASNRLFAEGQTCFVTITAVSGTFQNGMLQFSMLS